MNRALPAEQVLHRMARVDAKQQVGIGQAEVAIDDGDPQPALVQANGQIRR